MRTPLLKVLFTECVLWVLLYLMLFPQWWVLFETIWIVFSLVFLVFLPGNWLTFCFFPYDSLSRFERFIMSFLLSVTAVVLFSYYLYYAWITPTHMSIYVAVFCLLFLSILVALIRYKIVDVDWIEGNEDFIVENEET